MNRTILISIGVLIILALAGVWAYLLFSEDEPSMPNFGDLSGIFSGGGDDAPPTTTPEPTATSTPPESEQLVVESALQQLTTRPTIGHRFIGSTSSPRIIYAEAGTGHIYAIDLTDNTETRLSNTTVAGASQALFSASGTAAAIITNEGESIIGQLNATEMELETRPLPVTMHEPFVRGESELLFLETDGSRSVARSIDMYTLEEQVLFTLPFTQAAMTWMPTGSMHYTYPKAARELPGYLYAANGTGLSPTGIDGFGLAALAGPSHFLASMDEQLNGNYGSAAVEKTSGVETALPFVFLPEKCAFSRTDTTALYCAAPFDTNTEALPDQWHQGRVQFNDLLWQVDVESGEATLLVSFTEASGREVDAVEFVVSETDSRLLFRNKNDNSLWLYELES